MLSSAEIRAELGEVLDTKPMPSRYTVFPPLSIAVEDTAAMVTALPYRGLALARRQGRCRNHDDVGAVEHLVRGGNRLDDAAHAPACDRSVISFQRRPPCSFRPNQG